MSWYGDLGNWAKNTVFGGDASSGINAKLGNYDMASNQLGQMAMGAQGRPAPMVQGQQLATGNIDQSRAGLMGTAGSLAQIASGQRAGAGELAVNRQMGQATAAQLAAARSAHGANAALAYRNAARNTMDLGQQAAAQAAQAQMADQQAALAQQGGLYGQAYGLDTSVAAQNAGLGQQAALANQNAQLQQTGLNDARQIQAIGQLLGWDQASISAAIQKAQIAAGDKGILPSLIAGGGQIAAAYAGMPSKPGGAA